jgi:3',5'-cyclic AMP phosphodiesterase CpdA
MSLLIQISDPHFGTEQAPVVAALAEMIRELEPALVVLSGDITQRARRSQFAAAAQFMEQLEVPGLIVPGNHDIPLFNLFARVFSPYGNYAREFGDELEPMFESDDLLVVGVNTTRAARRKDGEISPEQIADVSRKLRRARPEQLRIVVTHQPLHAIRESDYANLLHGHEAAIHAWSEAGADILMGGHIHLPYVRPCSERFDDLARELWVVQAGTAVSKRVRDGVPNSVNVLRHARAEPEVCAVERWDYDAALARFKHFGSHRLELVRTRASAPARDAS